MPWPVALSAPRAALSAAAVGWATDQEAVEQTTKAAASRMPGSSEAKRTCQRWKEGA